MDLHETNLLEKLQEYSELKAELKQCTEDIESILLLYDFDIEEISKTFPVINELYVPSGYNAVKRIRTYF